MNTITYGYVSSTQSVSSLARVRVSQLDASSAVLTALEVGEGVVQHGRADRPRPAEVVVGPLDREASDRDAALVRAQHGVRRSHAA